MSMKQKSVSDVEIAQHDEAGNFGAGLFLGIVGGALGMFLFGTKQGRQVLQKVKEEFSQNAGEFLQSESVQQALPAVEETKKQVEKVVGTWKNTFPKFQKKQ